MLSTTIKWRWHLRNHRIGQSMNKYRLGQRPRLKSIGHEFCSALKVHGAVRPWSMCDAADPLFKSGKGDGRRGQGKRHLPVLLHKRGCETSQTSLTYGFEGVDFGCSQLARHPVEMLLRSLSDVHRRSTSENARISLLITSGRSSS